MTFGEKGPRQIGKTESIKRFAEENYKSVIEINFVTSEKYKQITADGYNAESVIKSISLIDQSHKFIPEKMIIGGVFNNTNKHLPDAPDRIWYEADINYYKGKRNGHRILWSNDGLIFVTYDHYLTFYEIV